MRTTSKSGIKTSAGVPEREKLVSSAPATHPRSREMPHRPFYFNTSAHLLRITRERASSLSELLQAVHDCSEDSIFQHTFRTLEEHHLSGKAFPTISPIGLFPPATNRAWLNAWQASTCALLLPWPNCGNGLSRSSTSTFATVPKVPIDGAYDTFYFCASDTVVLPTPFVAHTLAEFAEGLRQVSVHSIHHHFIEARLRLKLMSNDFSQWLQEDMDLTDAARQLNRIDIYTGTLEDVRRQLVTVVERALA